MAVCLKDNRPLNNVEVVIERPDGARKQFLVNPRPIRDSQSALLGAVNTLIDLTDARSAQHALESAQRFSRLVLSSSPIASRCWTLKDGCNRSTNADALVSKLTIQKRHTAFPT
jgi:PAS domain-containing protein